MEPDGAGADGVLLFDGMLGGVVTLTIPGVLMFLIYEGMGVLNLGYTAAFLFVGAVPGLYGAMVVGKNGAGVAPLLL